MGISLKDYITKLKEIEAPMNSVYHYFKEEIDTLLLQTYDQGQNPYQQYWAPRLRPYGWAILNKTGKQRNSFKTTISKGTFTITNTAPYAKYHQDGTKYMAQRKIIPDEGMPKQWEAPLEDYFSMTLQEYLEA